MMPLLAYQFLLTFFPVVYRLRGSGVIGNLGGYAAWAATVFTGVFLLTLNPVIAALSAFGSFCGKWIGHSKFYQVRSRSGTAGAAEVRDVRR